MLMEALAYFDNAATTFPKPKEVYDFADSFYRNCGGNIGRGGNVLAVKAGKIQKEAKFMDARIGKPFLHLLQLTLLIE